MVWCLRLKLSWGNEICEDAEMWVCKRSWTKFNRFFVNQLVYWFFEAMTKMNDFLIQLLSTTVDTSNDAFMQVIKPVVNNKCECRSSGYSLSPELLWFLGLSQVWRKDQKTRFSNWTLQYRCATFVCRLQGRNQISSDGQSYFEVGDKLLRLAHLAFSLNTQFHAVTKAGDFFDESFWRNVDLLNEISTDEVKPEVMKEYEFQHWVRPIII